MLAATSTDIANTSYLWIYVLIGAGTIVVGLWKRTQVAGFLKRFGGVGAAKSVVDLFEKEVSELRIQRAELLSRIEDLERSNVDLNNQIKFLVTQMTGEAPIRELSHKIDSLTTQMVNGLSTILQKVGGQ